MRAVSGFGGAAVTVALAAGAGCVAGCVAGCANNAPGENVVTITSTAGAPKLFAYRDGAPGSLGDWQTPVQLGATTFELRVGDAYELVAVCVDAIGDVDGIERVATVSGDGASGQLACPVAMPASATGSVQGTLAQPGLVSIGGIAQTSPAGTAGAWVYQIAGVPYGVSDRIAVATNAGSGAIAIFRGEVVGGDEVAEPALDLATAGTALTALPLTVTGAAGGDAVVTTVQLVTSGGGAPIAAIGTTALLVPPALLAPNDHQSIAVSATAGTFVRMAESLDTSITTFALPPRLLGVGFAPNDGGQVVASWSGGLPDAADDVVLFLEATGDATQAYTRATVTASASWLTATGATSLAYDTSAPGFAAAWEIDGANASPKLAVETSTPGGAIGVSLVSE